MGRKSVLLASASPRRRTLLEQIGVTFRTVRLDIDESRGRTETPEVYVSRLAREKARAAADLRGKDELVLAADTVVVIDDEVLQKPVDQEDGIRMLGRLSGRSHQVLTAVALYEDGVEALLNRSEVTFRAVSPQERLAYWRSGEPLDKAGGYAIQGIGAIFIERISGSYSGVMGLPLFETAHLLKTHGLEIF